MRKSYSYLLVCSVCLVASTTPSPTPAPPTPAPNCIPGVCNADNMQRGEVTFPRTDQAGNWTKVACCCSYAGPVVCGALCTFPIPYSDDDGAFGDDDGRRLTC